jgi:acyl-CoA reductase-like NAD-dependent aldehyde dehydrogenase
MPERSYGLFIDGKDTPSTSGRFLQVENPATGKIVAHAPEASYDDVAVAAQSAEGRFRLGRRLASASAPQF